MPLTLVRDLMTVGVPTCKTTTPVVEIARFLVEQKRNKMSTHETAPDKEYSLPALANILLTAWGCSFLWGAGLIFAGGALFAAMWGGWWSSDGGPVWETLTVIAFLLGLATIISSPILLGATITRNWQQNIKAGLGSFLAGILTFLAVWIGDGVFNEWVHSRTGWTENPLLLIVMRTELALILLVSLTAYTVMTAFILLAKIHQYRTLGLIAGGVVGVSLSMINGMMLGTSLLKGDNIFHFIWQIPLFVWISVIYFAELLAGRSKWTDFLVWAFLVLISFGLPFVVVPLFPLISN